MSTLKLLAVGGPKHGEYIGDANVTSTFRVPIRPELSAILSDAPFWYCVHDGEGVSQRDGDLHWVSATRVAGLYGLVRNEYRCDFEVNYHRTGPYCIGPRHDGRYVRADLPPLATLSSSTIRVGVYEKKGVADVGVWLYRGEE